MVGTAPARADWAGPTRGDSARSARTDSFAPGGDVLATLQRLLDGVLRERGGDSLLARRARLLASAIECRRDPRASTIPGDLADAQGSDDLLLLARACAMQLAIANVADELRRKRERTSDPSRATRPPLDIRLVLTAHPTGIVRRSVITKHRAVCDCLERLEDPSIDCTERRWLEDDIGEALSLWYATSEVRAAPPRVSDEVRRLLFFFESVLFDSVADLARDHLDADDQHDGAVPLRFGSWAGADMDGNPYVTPETIIETARAHRIMALRLLADRTFQLRREFSQPDSSLRLTDALRASLARDQLELPRTACDLDARYPHEAGEPLRRKLAFVVARLRNALAVASGESVAEPGYSTPQELLSDLGEVRDSLCSRAVRSGRIERLMWQVRVFGFHLATLEARENAPMLHEACRLLLPDYAGAGDEARRVAILTDACVQRRSSAPVPDPAPKAAAALDAIAQTIRAYGPESADTFIISNAERPSDVLCALWLARRSGLFGQRSAADGTCRSELEIVPLFERRGALERSALTMAQLYDNDAYRQHLDARGGRQEIMLGYSDAGKDAGYLASQWAMYETQESLASQAAEHEVELRLFHGRGGSSSRGGGPIWRSIRTQPPGTIGGRIKITEQGEVINAKFSNRALAVHSLEQTLAAVTHASLQAGPDPDPAWRREIARIADAARGAYQELVLADPGFPAVFRDCTTIELLDQMNIGSRPARRDSELTVESLRAIPWVFAWMQNRVCLPAWYGAGTGLEGGDPFLQRQMFNRWPFFTAAITTLEMALAATDLTIGERYFQLATDTRAAGRIWELISSEHQRCEERVTSLTGRDRLGSPSPEVLERHAWRTGWLDALNLLQIELIRRHRAGEPSARDPLLATIAGIAAGIRTTG
jgi:phosphoenolpyruvate carboxylase